MILTQKNACDESASERIHRANAKLALCNTLPHDSKTVSIRAWNTLTQAKRFFCPKGLDIRRKSSIPYPHAIIVPSNYNETSLRQTATSHLPNEPNWQRVAASWTLCRSPPFLPLSFRYMIDALRS